jgi:transposase
MEKRITFGLDLAKHSFQVHGVDEAGSVVVERRLRRGEVLTFFSRQSPALIGMEACGTAHYWARELRQLGHDVRLMPPTYVKPYVKRQKNDAADAAAIAEAVGRPGMRFVAVKTPEQQAAQMVHRGRDILIRQRTMLINAIRGHLAEFGIIAPRGPAQMKHLAQDFESSSIPEAARQVIEALQGALASVEAHIAAVTGQITAHHKASDVSQRLATIPGVGPITASALIAAVPEARAFRSGRHFAAALGLVPRQRSTGGKPQLGRITKQGNPYLRRLLIIGAQSVLHWSERKQRNPWIVALRGRRPRMVAAVAVANKTARIAWALMAHGGTYRYQLSAA